MHLYTALQMGQHHQNHCEDHLLITDLGPDCMLLAVMDGCTMGTESHFASALTAKALRKTAKELAYDRFLHSQSLQELDVLMQEVMKRVMALLSDIQQRLLLEREEMLCTLVLLLANQKTAEGLALCIGDGVVCVNGHLHDFDQDNRPDYLGYHLRENFEHWFEQQKQRIHIPHCRDVSISTDGIFTFVPNKPQENPSNVDPIHHLLVDKSGASKPRMLEARLHHLAHVHHLSPTDDLAIIRMLAD